jgi:ABC-type transport system involved in multi-copper enzyme maturation permease subunit
MIWLTWRQFRTQALTALVILTAAAIYFLITGLHMHHTYTADLASCPSQNDCGGVLSQLQQSYNAAFNLTQLLVIIVPALIGIFWGAPLIGRELETGTHQLVWNQSVTRSRWLAAKLFGTGIAAMAAAGLLSLLLTWWAGPLDQIDGSRFAALTFSTRDIAPLAYAAFAFALGTTLGLLLRRTIPAMALTLAVFIGVQILVPTTIRPNLLPSTTVTFPVDQATASRADGVYGQNGGADFYFSGLSIPQNAWVISDPPVENSSDQVVAMSNYLNCFPAESPAASKADRDFSQLGSCLAGYDLHESVIYQPASHYWPLQWIETAFYLVLAAILSGSCFWWIRRRQN